MKWLLDEREPVHAAADSAVLITYYEILCKYAEPICACVYSDICSNGYSSNACSLLSQHTMQCFVHLVAVICDVNRAHIRLGPLYLLPFMVRMCACRIALAG